MNLLKMTKIICIAMVVIFFNGCTLMVSKKKYTLENTRWKLVKILNEQVNVIGNDIFILFRSRDNRVLGYGGCREIFGFYKTVNQQIEITLENTSSQICPNSYLELQLLEGLTKIDEYEIKEEKLYLKNYNSIIFTFLPLK